MSVVFGRIPDAPAPDDGDYDVLFGLLDVVMFAAYGDSNDTEIEALQDALAQACSMLGIDSVED